MDGDIDRILWTAPEISDRVSELAAEISRDFKDHSSSLVVVGVATGAFLFLADLVRKITLPIAVDFVRVESYGSGTESSSKPKISCDVKVAVSGKHVIVVEDIVDTGHTLSCLISHLQLKGASSISVCTFLDKPARRRVHFKLVGEGKFYRGFEGVLSVILVAGNPIPFLDMIVHCPDDFIVGYGMDFAELYRNLPYVGGLKPEKYT